MILDSVRGFARVKRDAAGELAEMLSKDQPSAMQTRLESLRLHAKDCTCLFRRQTLDVPKDHRHTVNLRQVCERVNQTIAHLTAHDLIVGERRPVRGILR